MAERKGALDPQNFIPFKLIEKEQVTGNTYRFRFELPDNQASGMFVASCLLTKAVLAGEPGPVIRPYTPTSGPEALGYVELVIKVYPQGKMSQHILSLNVGDSLEMKGPNPKLPYKPNMVKKIGMVAGGTGITPMTQVMDAIAKNLDDTTEVTLVYANNSEDDIILKAHIDAIVAVRPTIKVHYVVSKLNNPDTPWTGSLGHIDKALLEKLLPSPSENCKVLVCGPPGLMDVVSGNKVSPMDQGELKGYLKDLGFAPEQVFKF